MAGNIIEFQHVSKSFDDHLILDNINLSIQQGEFLTLLGPSGCGKTTLLRMISGFETPDSGKIFLQGKEVDVLPPHLRKVHTVFQSYALFPHMSAYENVAFGLRCQKVAEDDIHERVTKALEMVKLNHLAARKPDQLSGGQQQRIAIARAVVNRPLALLLDEPLSSLDYRLRKNMQIELKHLQRELGITFIFVTHDQEEALSMSDRIVLLDHGRIQQVGSPRELYEEPKNLLVARFVGEVNIFDCVIEDANETEFRVKIENQMHTYKNKNNYQAGDKVHILVRPEDLRAWDNTEVDDTSDMIRGVVEDVIYKGTTVDLMIRLPSNKLIAATSFFDEDDENLDYRDKDQVWVHWTPGWEVILPYEAN